MSSRRFFPLLLLAVTIVAVQMATAVTGTEYYLTQLTMAAYYSLVVIGLCVLMGYAGQISLGHAGFFAIGGYLAAALTTRNLLPYQDFLLVKILSQAGVLISRQDLFGQELLYFHPWAGCIAAVLTAMLISLIIGWPVLRLKGHYLAMATLGFGIIIYRLVLATDYFGEADGISGVPPFELLPGMAVGGDFGSRVLNYYIAWIVLLVGTALLINLVHSRTGRALRSIHGSEEAANAMGVDTSRIKLLTFVLSAAFASVAGVLLTHYNGG
ncbi:MAG: branched-chain amino acid ABC transporter permease, partial [Desulfovibrionales bacterium]